MRVLSLFAVLLAAGGSNALRIAHETRTASSLAVNDEGDGVCGQCFTTIEGRKSVEYCSILNNQTPLCNFPKCDCDCDANSHCDCECKSKPNGKNADCGCNKGPAAVCADPPGTTTCAPCKGPGCTCEVTQPGTNNAPFTTTCDCSANGGATCTCRSLRLQCTKRAAACSGCRWVCPEDETIPCGFQCSISGNTNAACNATGCMCYCDDDVNCNCTCGTEENCMCFSKARLMRGPSRTTGV